MTLDAPAPAPPPTTPAATDDARCVCGHSKRDHRHPLTGLGISFCKEMERRCRALGGCGCESFRDRAPRPSPASEEGER